MIRQCKHCSANIDRLHHKICFCSDDCKKASNLIDATKKSHLEYPAGTEDDRVECPICHLRAHHLNSKHFKSHHNLTKEEVKAKYPDFSFVSVSEKKLLSERISGANNPGYQHGGRLSPSSKNFVAYSDLSEEDRAAAALAKSAQAQSNTEFYNNQIGYYLNKGMSQIEAEEALRKRQVTFNLDICIEKHGEAEGRRVWQERQDKWLASLNAKSDEEKAEINRKKSTKVNYRSLWGGDLDSPGWFYLIKFEGDLYKYGITSKDSIYKRYHDFSDELLVFANAKDINHAFAIEQVVKSRNIQYKVGPDDHPYGHYGWTEVLRGCDEISLIELVNGLLINPDRSMELFEEVKSNQRRNKLRQ